MDGEERSHGSFSPNAMPATSYRRSVPSEDIFPEMLNWIQDANTDQKLAENAVNHISEKLRRKFDPLETTGVETQYVKAVLTTWTEASLKSMFNYLEDEKTDICKEMPTILDELNSVYSVEDINTKLNQESSQLWTWFDGGRLDIQLILEQENLFKNTPRFAILLNHYFNNVKRCFINKVFARSMDDIINDGLNGSSLKEFISALTDFLTNANEDKHLQDVVKNYMRESNVTTKSRKIDGQVIKDDLNGLLTEEDIPDEFDELFQDFIQDESKIATDSTETDGQNCNGMKEWVNKLIEIVRNALPSSDSKESLIPKWLLRFESVSSEIKEWTAKLELLIRETCAKLILPETVIEVKQQYGRPVMFISGVAVFVSKELEQMKSKKRDVEEIQIVGQTSVHIDCDLENEIWHGINVGIVTDKLVVWADDKDENRIWDVSGRSPRFKSRGDWQDAGESGGNVHIKCNEIIGADRWTIASNGGDGVSALKWSLEEFKKIFSPILPPDTDMKKDKENEQQVSGRSEIIDLYAKLETNMRKEFGGKVRIDGLRHSTRLNDGSEITCSLYQNKKKKRHTLILCKGAAARPGGYGGDIIFELSNKERCVPPTGMEMYQALDSAGVVYKATGSDGKMGQANGDVGFIHNEAKTSEGRYVGFEISQSLSIQRHKKEEFKKDKVASYVRFDAGDFSGDGFYATIVDVPDAVKQKEQKTLYTKKRFTLSSMIAKKKNAVLRQSLVVQFTNINERKQVLESLRKTLTMSNPLEENQSQNVDRLMEEIRNNAIQSDEQVYQQWNQEKVAHTKPAPIVRSRSARETKGEGPINLQPEKDEEKRRSNFEHYDKLECHKKEVEKLFNRIEDKRKKSTLKANTKKWTAENKLRYLDPINIASLAEYFYDFECALQQLRKDNTFQLRNYQIEAILQLIIKTNKETERILAEISTGAGKSLIVAASAIAITRGGRAINVHVITSNDLLAIRDSNLPVAEGGLKDLYEYFNVQVANNCSQIEDDRKASYTARVVYGQLANFQRDYLLDNFYGRNIRGSPPVTAGVAIIDEVDCMLLDQGNNTLYLSHGIPGMETLESLYVFIWDEICNSPNAKSNSHDREQVKTLIRSRVLFDLYGVMTKDDLKSFVHAPLSDLEKDALWNHLIEKEVIDRNGRLLIVDANQMTKEKINYTPKNALLKEANLNAKLVFYLSKVANRQRQIRIPAHLLDFVDRHLGTWLESAFQALDLRPDEDYVIDQDRTDTSPDLNPQVIIIDPDTGTDQTLSQWDEALHQFVQLKEGCKLTLQSLKAVFISNATYINQYPNIYGLSGTLGSEQEKHFLQDTFKSTFYYNHTHIPKLFEQKPTKVLSTENDWLDAIISETKTVMKEGRSIIIFCVSIKNVNLVHQRLKSSIPELLRSNRLHRYTRDYVQFAFERTELDIERVIVATNLAGRGTNIKISQKLRENGGLHVCLSYFPENQRIEEQAMGRAARNGAPGSGILIVCKSISSEGSASDEKGPIEIMKNEREIREKQRIARMKEDFNFMKGQKELIDAFSIYYTNLKEQWRKKNVGDQIASAICGGVLDQWAMWLDEMNDSSLDVKKYSYSEKFIPKLKAVEQDNLDISQIEWMTPARLVAVARHLATRYKKPDLPKAVEILEQLIQSKDRHFYPAAFYYRAFVLLKENYETNKNEFIKLLRTCENVLCEHIDLHFSIVQKMGRKTDQSPSFCVVDGYTQQKENLINLFQYFLGSVRSLLGTDCSIEDFEAAGRVSEKVKGFFEKNLNNFKKWIECEHKNFQVLQDKDKNISQSKIPAEKVEEYFKLLLEGESKCIGHQLNDASTIPSWNSSFEHNAKSNRQLAIERIANANGVCALALEKSLSQAIQKELSREDIEESIENKMKKKFEEDNLIPCKRESFWAKLVETGALYNNQNFVALDECNVDTFNLRRNEAKTFPFDDKDYVLYNPIDVNGKNGQEKKLFFTQKYVEDTLYGNLMNNTSRYRLQVNKIAKIDVMKLKSVDLKLFGQLTDDDLRKIDIIPAERQGIMDELKKQDIIDDDGNLSPNYNGQTFEYPNCPAYEDPVMRLVGSKLRAEIVRRQWLNSKGNSNRLAAINLLPLTPYRDMLEELIAAYVISGGVRMNRMDESVLEKKVKEITQKDHERECILDFLKGRQAIYDATWLASQEAALDFIDGDIRKVKAHTFESELSLLRSIGFDHVIYMKDRQLSRKQMVLSSLFTPLVIIGGVASISAGTVLTLFSKILPFRVAKDLLLMGGISDILFIITSALSNEPIRVSDYARQRIRSAIGKANLVDQVKNLWKLSKDGKLAFNSFRPAVRLEMDSFHQRRVREKNHEADQRAIVNALLQLKKISTNPDDEDDGEFVRSTCL